MTLEAASVYPQGLSAVRPLSRKSAAQHGEPYLFGGRSPELGRTSGGTAGELEYDSRQKYC